MSAYSETLMANFGAANAGQTAQYQVTGADGTVHTSFTSVGVAEKASSPGTYYARGVTLDDSWLPIEIDWQIAALSIGVSEVLTQGRSYATNIPAGGIVIQMTVASAAGAIGNGATQRNVVITRATDCSWLFTFSNTDGTAKDITGVTAELLVKRNVNDLDGAALITMTTANRRITLPSPANGQMFANILAADTYELPVNGAFSLFPNECSYVYGLKVWNLGGQQVAEAAGRFTVVPFAVQSRTSP